MVLPAAARTERPDRGIAGRAVNFGRERFQRNSGARRTDVLKKGGLVPDSVICTQTAPHTFSCDVELSPEASSAATLAAPQPSAKAITQTPNPAVATLVTSYQRVELPTPEKPYLPASTLLKCASSDAAVIAALAAQSAGTLALLGAFKAGFDMGKCIAQEHNAAVSEAGAQESAADCAAAGGTVTGTNGNTTFCEVDRSAR